MTTETVTVAFVNPPKDGRQYGSIKTQDGKFISVHADKLGQFQKGGSYVVEYETTDKGYHNFKRIVSGGGAATSASPGHSGGRGDDPVTAERIYVCGIVNAAVPGLLDKGHLTGVTLVKLTNEARQAWRQTFGDKGGSPIPNDDIGF